MVNLGTLGFFSSANGVSADGSVVVGQSGGAIVRAFRWTEATGMVDIGTLNGGDQTRAFAVNADGSVIVGDAFDGPGGPFRAIRWTAASGIVSLGTLPNGSGSTALAVNADGSVVVGFGSQGANPQRGFRWTQASGMQTIEEWLRANGVNVAADMGVSIATGVDASGNVVVGFIEGPLAFIARVSPNGSGMITPDFYGSLASASPQLSAFDAGGLILHGSHGNPLLGTVRPGQSCVWASGDWGRNDHGSRDGSLGLAEFGVCRLLGAVQLGASLGLTRSRQDLVFNGSSDLDGRFATVEATAQLGKSALWGTLTGLYHWGDADVRRGYLNAGMPDASRGSTDTHSWAVRARLDWADALSAAGISFSPYGDLTHIKTHVDSYTESDGGFPVSFEERKESITELRLGLNASKPVSRIRLLGTLEAVHRFDGESTRNTGQILGLFSYDVRGRQYERNWLRAGIGFDAKLGAGTGLVMLNATTKGEAPSHWLAASYRVAF
jgi:probable HAF family extracellular repeat protein